MVLVQLFMPNFGRAFSQPKHESTVDAQANVQLAPLRFEVASIREDRSQDTGHRSVTFKKNRFIAESVPLRNLVCYAYGKEDYQVRWEQSKYADRLFTIQALVSDEILSHLDKLTGEQALATKRLMVQTLLSERFGLLVHENIESLPGYTLTVGRGGIKFSLASEEQFSSPSEIKTPQMQFTKFGEMHAENLTWSEFVRFLSNEIGHPVNDQTGLKGAATFDLQWAQNIRAISRMLPPSIASVIVSRSMTDETNAPQLPTALKEQLGLILKYQKTPQRVLVIDKINMPTEN
jgi:uncharacterized protein (TIGR03435 family)